MIDITDLVYWGVSLFLYLLIAFYFVVKIKYKVEGSRWELPTDIFLVLPFVVFDLFVNVTVFTVLTLDPPRGLELVTGRMKRYKRKYAATPPRSRLGWYRWRFAIRLCKLINQADKDHC